MKLRASRSAQYPLEASFTFTPFNWVNDSVDLGAKTLGATVALSTDPTQAGLVGPVANTVVFDALPLPPNAVLIGGEVIVGVGYVGPTAATLSLGTAAAPTSLVNAVDITAVARAPLSLATPLASQDGSNLRMTLTYSGGNATAGSVRLRVMYTIDGRAHEVQIT